MALAQGNVVKTKFIAEVTPGVTPSNPALKLLNTKSAKLDPSVSTVTSATIRSDRATTDLVPTGSQASANIAFELRYGEFDAFVESALGGTASTAFTLTATNISAASADNSINSATSAFSTANILPGHWLVVRGFAQGTKVGKVVSVTTAKIILSHCTLTTEVAGPSVTVKGQSVRNAAVKKTFTIENEYTDLSTVFEIGTGMQVNNMALNLASQQVIEGSFDFLGLADTYVTTQITGATEVAAATTNIMSAQGNVNAVYVDGTQISATYMKSLNLSTTNNLRSLDGFGGTTGISPVGVNMGTFGATIAMNAYFNDASLLNKLVSNTALTLAYYMTDSAGNIIVVDLPYAKVSAGSDSGSGLNADIMQDLTITALNSPTLNYMLQISYLAA